MDTMSLRLQGEPENPQLMRFLLFVMRLCLAAHLHGQNAETLLGRGGHILKAFLERSHLAGLVIFCFVKRPGRVIGIGGQSIVILSSHTPGYVEKYNYTLAGASSKALDGALQLHLGQQQDLEEHFPGLVKPTDFGIATLPLRWPFNKLTTLYSRQRHLSSFVDIFSPEASELLAESDAALHHEIGTLARQARAWAKRNKWLDLVGPNNVVLAVDDGKPSIHIIDTGLYAAEYIADCNPMLGRSYKDVFMERLRYLETHAAKITILTAMVGMGVLGMVYGHHDSLHHAAAFLDDIEDRLIG